MLKKYLIIIIFIIFCAILFFVKIHVTLSGLSTTKYVILVNKKNQIKKRDLKKTTIGYLMQDELPKKYNEKFTYKAFYDMSSIISSLRSEEIGAMILESDMASIYAKDLDDVLKISGFKLKNVSAEQEKDIFTIYISGTDTYDDTSSRSDVNILAIINQSMHKILLVFIPRDYYLPFNQSNDKLTHITTYGMNASLASLSKFLNIDIDYYLKVNFQGFIDIIDLLDGVNVYSDTSFNSIDGYKFIKGYNKLSGKQALSFVRERYAFNEGDKKRGINQQEVIKSVIDKVSKSNFLFNYGKYLKIISNNIETNMSEKKIIDLVKCELKNNKAWNIETYNLDGIDSYEYTYTYPNEKVYVMIPTENKLHEKIKEIGG